MSPHDIMTCIFSQNRWVLMSRRESTFYFEVIPTSFLAAILVLINTYYCITWIQWYIHPQTPPCLPTFTSSDHIFLLYHPPLNWIYNQVLGLPNPPLHPWVPWIDGYLRLPYCPLFWYSCPLPSSPAPPLWHMQSEKINYMLVIV